MLTKQRDQLLAALEKVISYEHGFCTTLEDLREIARQAIAAIKEQQ